MTYVLDDFMAKVSAKNSGKVEFHQAVRESADYVNYMAGANIGGFVKVADSMLAQGIV